MTPSVAVFLGPSVAREEASRELAAIYRPPAEQGDIVRILQERHVDTIVIIDGVFAQAPAVRHKEILWALSKGIRVYGAASMGAIRAAELHSFGMRGYGLIYRWYRATLLADDDEVAVAMMPSALGAHALGEALIDIRLTLRLAERHRIISPRVRHLLEHVARSIHFLDRTYARLYEEGQRSLPPDELPSLERLELFVADHARLQKRADALGVLRWVARSPCEPNAPPRPDAFRMTEAWAADLAAAGIAKPDIL